MGRAQSSSRQVYHRCWTPSAGAVSLPIAGVWLPSSLASPVAFDHAFDEVAPVFQPALAHAVSAWLRLLLALLVQRMATDPTELKNKTRT